MSLPIPLLLALAGAAAPQAGEPPLTSLPGVRNAREVLDLRARDGRRLRPGVLYRSGSLAEAPAEVLEELERRGIRTVLDLRTLGEIREEGAIPAPWGRKPIYRNLPLYTERSIQDPAARHRALFLEHPEVLAGVLQALADPERLPVWILDDQGFERTGIVVAAVLEVAGVGREDIFSDFETNDGTLRPRREWLQAVMAVWDAHRGGLAGWLEEQAGVDRWTLEAVRHHLFEETPWAPPAELREAEELLARAEAQARAGQYGAAVRTYERLAKKYPETPAGRTGLRRSRPNALLGWRTLVDHGPPENRVDIVLFGEGYTLKSLKQFDKTAGRVPRVFERHAIFGEYWEWHNLHAGILRSHEDGVDGFGGEFDTALDARDSGASQGQVAVDPRKVMQYLEEIPVQDHLAIVFVKRGSLGTGGGGIATIGGENVDTILHEWGHAFGGLRDEYSSDVGYRGAVRSGVNVAESPDPQRAPWRHWIEAGHPRVGLFEGAAGRARGAWKPTASGCAMASGKSFCVVCREQLVLALYRYVDPIDSCSPEAQPLETPRGATAVPPLRFEPDRPLAFEVEVLRPRRHDLEVRWWVLPEGRVPPDPVPRRGRGRERRGPLARIEEEPAARTRGDREGRHRFELEAEGLEPGRYRVLCRVRDTTLLPGEDWPWVLRDEAGLLESERAWWLVVSAPEEVENP